MPARHAPAPAVLAARRPLAADALPCCTHTRLPSSTPLPAPQLETISAVAPTHPTLDAVVAAGKADGSITVKNSPARNVHRMMCTLSFIAAIFENLMAPQGMTLKEAVSEAYDRTLGQLHAWVRRGRVTGAVVVGQGR